MASAEGRWLPVFPLSAVLLQPRFGTGYLSFDILGQPDRRYEVQTSTNGSYWQSLCTLMATNNLVAFTDTNHTTTAPRFYRTITPP